MADVQVPEGMGDEKAFANWTMHLRRSAPRPAFCRERPARELSADAHEQANVTSFNMVLAFSQRVRLKETIVAIRNSRGARVTIGDLRTGENGTDLEIPLSTPLRPDTYSIRWRAVSIQGLVDVGGYDFVIDPMPTGVPGVAQQ